MAATNYAAAQLLTVTRKSQEPRSNFSYEMADSRLNSTATATFESSLRASLVLPTGNSTINKEIPPIYDNPISTTAILIIAVGSSALIILLIILGLLYFKRRKERPEFAGDTHLRDEKVTKPFLESKNYKKPDIVITEPTSDDKTSGNASFLEVYSARSATHVANCALATLEDLEENELVSPAVTGQNPSASNHKPERNNPRYPEGGDKHDQRDWDRNGNILVNLADEEVAAIDPSENASSHRAERTQSLSSMGRPSYAYSSQSPYGQSPYGYGIGDLAEVSPAEDNTVGQYSCSSTTIPVGLPNTNPHQHGSS